MIYFVLDTTCNSDDRNVLKKKYQQLDSRCETSCNLDSTHGFEMLSLDAVAELDKEIRAGPKYFFREKTLGKSGIR
jgi:hypothetical protein